MSRRKKGDTLPPPSGEAQTPPRGFWNGFPTTSRFPKSNLFKVGDFVTVRDASQERPGIVLEMREHSAFPYRVGGSFVTGELWDAWFPNWQLAHDISATDVAVV